MDNISIIISRYNENLNWTIQEPFCKFKYIVYNKGTNDDFEKTNVTQIINLPNVGKCDHTYLYHIIENYNNLSNIIVFLPGSINHPVKIIKARNILLNIINSNFTKAYFIGEYNKINNIQNKFKDFQLNNWVTTDRQNFSINTESKLQLCRIRPYGKWFRYFFGNIQPHWNTYCGVFSIDKRDINQHPIERYQQLLETVNKHSNPEAGHYLERSWCAVFYPLIFTIKLHE
jgi:hypothetical protein